MFNAFDFNGFDNVECEVVVKIGKEIIRKQTLRIPYILMQNEFYSLIQQISQEQKPMQVKFTNASFQCDSESTKKPWVIFSNNSYLKEFPNEE